MGCERMGKGEERKGTIIRKKGEWDRRGGKIKEGERKAVRR